MKESIRISLLGIFACLSLSCHAMDPLREKLAKVYGLEDGEYGEEFKKGLEEYRAMHRDDIWLSNYSLQTQLMGHQSYEYGNRMLLDKYIKEVGFIQQTLVEVRKLVQRDVHEVRKEIEKIRVEMVKVQEFCLALHEALKGIKDPQTKNDLEEEVSKGDGSSGKKKKKKSSGSKIGSQRKAHDTSPRSKAGEK